MKMMSVTESDIGWAWFFSFLCFHFVTAVLCTFVSKRLYRKAEVSLLFTFWIFALIAIIVVAMLLATFFSKTTRATFVGLLVFFFGHFTTLAEDFDTGDPGNLRLISLHPIAVFSYAFREIGRLEDGAGLSVDAMTTTDYASGYTFANILRYLIFDSIIWGIFVWYLNRVIPPAYGQALPFYFPFTVSYWCPSRSHKGTDLTSAEAPMDTTIPVEPVSDALRRQAREGKSIEIHNLKRTFGGTKIAVDDLNLSIYNGEITALLGHNGGKVSLL